MVIATVAATALVTALGGIIAFGIGLGVAALKEMATGFAEMGAEAENSGTKIINIKKIAVNVKTNSEHIYPDFPNVKIE
jgi:hypothetical protein